MSVKPESMVKRYKVFVDTCSLMHSSAEEFFLGPLSRSFSTHDDKLVVVQQVIHELQRLSNGKGSNAQKKKASIGLNRILKKYKSMDILDVRGDPNEPFADANFLSVFTRFRTQLSLALITQDTDLARDIVELNEQRSVDSRYDVAAFKLTRTGKLNPWRFQKKGKSADSAQQSASHSPIRKREKVTLPTLPSTPTKLAQEPVSVEQDVSPGDTLITKENGKIRIGSEIGSGAQGTVYEVSDTLVCKIYDPRFLTERRIHKLEAMREYDIDIDGICWPTDLLYTKSDELIGYVMDRAKGKDLRHVILGRKVLETFPDWKRINLVELSIEILKKADKLHRMGILIGDINLDNIMVQDSSEVYLVDLDSCQIKDFPSAVAQPPFISPEIYKKLEGRNYRKFGEFLRTYDDEHFAIATLVFTILHPGQAPYTYQGGGSLVDNVKNQRFPYPLGDESTGDAPLGPWRFIWSNLPYRIKEMFYNIFAEGKRISAHEMIYELESYKGHLIKGHHSNDIFPKTYKIIDPVDVKCFLCGREVTQNRQFIESLKQQGKPFVCHYCRVKGRMPVPVKCSECGTETKEKKIFLQFLEKQGKDFVCDACREKWGKVSVPCSECGVEKEVMKGFLQDLREQGKSFVCEECREKWQKITVHCSRCGNEDEITIEFRDRLKSQGKEFVCEDCRERWKKVKVRCSECGDVHEVMKGFLDDLRNEGKSFVCEKCREKWKQVSVNCSECGKKHEITKGFLQDLRKQGKSFVCEKCREKWQKVTVYCSQCGVPHQITKGFLEKLRMDGKDYVCKECRAKWKKVRVRCSECGYATSITKGFLENLRIQGKNYVCDECRRKWEKVKLRCSECGERKAEITREYWKKLRNQGKDFVCKSCRSKW